MISTAVFGSVTDVPINPSSQIIVASTGLITIIRRLYSRYMQLPAKIKRVIAWLANPRVISTVQLVIAIVTLAQAASDWKSARGKHTFQEDQE